jgi:mRNA-degrading endonuclease toxin of MazEF toxin-antitoxin module
MDKDFESWNRLKTKLDETKKDRFFKEREIWWCHLGLNIGHEENGKNSHFSRPILVIKKFNKRLFLAVPLTTQVKENKYYHRFTFKEKDQCAMISQIRVLEVKRLGSRIGELPKSEFGEIRRGISGLLLEA